MATGEFFRRWRDYRRLIRVLRSYSDAELPELGMVGSACPRIAFNAAFGNPVEELRRWLKQALSATAANSSRETLLCYPAAEWREIEELPDVALDKPTLVEPVGAKPLPCRPAACPLGPFSE